MSFQLPNTNATPATGAFSFGAPAQTATGAAAAPKASGFSFGATGGGDAGAKAPGFALGTTTPAAVAATTAQAAPAAIGTGLGGGGTGFGFGGQATNIATATNPAKPAAQMTTTAPPATASTTSFSFGATAPKSAPSQQTSVALSAAPATTTNAPSAGGFASLSTATKTTDSSAVANASQLSYNQLEEHINKWTLELEDQEKVFTDQATQINAWDKILISNNQKILDLNDAVQKVKSDQQTLEQELEFISTQHKELEESIVPLQKEFMKIPQVDVERSQTYLMVENLDSQLKQMSEDLKEIIDNLNETSKCQDNTDPIIQIGKILNAHMSSLQWIEQSTSTIGTKLEDITKMHETFKRDSERSFRSAYYNN